MRFLFSVFFLSSILLSSARKWTSAQGSTIEAELISYEGGVVTLKKLNNGKTLSLRLEQLSKKDRDFLTKKDEKKKPAEKQATPDKRGRIDSGWTNWDAEFPKYVKVSKEDIEITEVEGEEGVYIYESPHFSFHSDVQLTTSLVREFARYFESTHAYVEALPLSMTRTQEEKKHVIQLLENKNDYYKNGGPEGSAGVFFSGKDLVLVPLASVGVKKVASRYSVDHGSSNKTLAHEIVHALTPRFYYAAGSRGWFTEGLAEYIAITPERSGTYQNTKAIGEVEQYVTGYSEKTGRGRNLGEEIKVGSLEKFMMMEYRDFTGNANFNYGVGALLVAYFIDLERDEELENLQSFLKALSERKKAPDVLAALLNGRTFQELEDAITKRWRNKGVKLDFSE